MWAYYTLLFCWVSFSIPRRVSNAWFGKLGCLLFAESRGGIRIHMNRDGKYGTIEMAVKPTAEQKKKLRSFINAVGGNVDIDFMDENYNTTHAVSYEGVSPARALSGITTFYDKGIKPKGNVSYSINREDIDAECREIERKAKANGTWLKAPNGKDTNLSPKQWVDVRTKAFRNGLVIGRTMISATPSAEIKSPLPHRRWSQRRMRSCREKQNSLSNWMRRRPH